MGCKDGFTLWTTWCSLQMLVRAENRSPVELMVVHCHSPASCKCPADKINNI